jgi:hypothetical protein
VFSLKTRHFIYPRKAISVIFSSFSYTVYCRESIYYGEIVERRYGGSNATRLTGIVQEICPDFISSFRQTLRSTLQKVKTGEHAWGGRESQPLGIRHFEYLSFDKEGLEDYHNEIKRKREEKEKKNAVFVIGGSSASPADRERDEKANKEAKAIMFQELKDSLYSDSESILTVFALFSDRSQFAGGEIQYSLGDDHHHPNNNQKEEEEDYDEDEDEGGDGNSDSQKNKKTLVSSQRKNSLREHKGNFEKPLVDTIILEKGNMLILNGEYDFALDKIIAGKRKGLLIELWKYKDSPISSRLLTGEEGVALGLAPEEEKEDSGEGGEKRNGEL